MSELYGEHPPIEGRRPATRKPEHPSPAEDRTVGEAVLEDLGVIARPTEGIKRIAAERARQVEHESYTADHDDHHRDGQLAWAAVSYISPRQVWRYKSDGQGMHFRDPWPEGWARRPTKPEEQTRLRQLEIAGALIAAEIDRLLRAEQNEFEI